MTSLVTDFQLLESMDLRDLERLQQQACRGDEVEDREIGNRDHAGRLPVDPAPVRRLVALALKVRREWKWH